MYWRAIFFLPVARCRVERAVILLMRFFPSIMKIAEGENKNNLRGKNLTDSTASWFAVHRSHLSCRWPVIFAHKIEKILQPSSATIEINNIAALHQSEPTSDTWIHASMCRTKNHIHNLLARGFPSLSHFSPSRRFLLFISMWKGFFRADLKLTWRRR